ncbi:MULTISPECIES: CidA/LrgA family protein [Bacillus]|uniref:CidA/LrgA family protein n=1 Tax=Bacillus TaxID=1386 RepID=UPI000BB7E9CB|nr:MULTISPECIES: CidA/LrgA family protein [Bacillus]
MKIIIISLQVILLYGLYQLGTIIKSLFNLPIPGSIIGMLLLFLLLSFGIIKDFFLQEGASFLLLYMPLLFIPATVGIMEYFSLFGGKSMLMPLAVLVSTLLIMAVSGTVGQKAAVRMERKQQALERNAYDNVS